MIRNSTGMLYSIGKWTWALVTLATLCFVSHPSGVRAETVFGIEPELAFKHIYLQEKNHKAMAIGPGGVWMYRSGASSAISAQKSVLRDCQQHLAKLGWTKAGKCELVAVDNQVLWTKPSVGQSLDVALALPDRPLARAKMFGPQQGGVPKGIVLALHGSENSYGVSSAPHPFQKSWFDYFNSIGFLVIFPSAYDDFVPAYEYAGWNDPSKYRDVTFITKLRIAQTKRTISVLKKQYPELPIYLWSHSAGGNIAQAVDKDIDGAIIVGAQCGIGHPSLNVIPKDVPILYVYGENDPNIIRGSKKLTPAGLRALCGKDYRGKYRQIVVAPKADHETPLWRQNVLDVVAKFFNQNSFVLANPKVQFDMNDTSKKAFEKAYRLAPLKKAFAVGKSGYGFSSSLSNQEDANLAALLNCNRTVTGLSYPKSGTHECSLFAVGNKSIAEFP